MSERLEKLCPECGETLNRDARRCACGWGAKKQQTGKVFDHRCTFRSTLARCEYPVGLFVEGATSGWCVFHRNNTDPALGAEIMRQSRSIPYAEAIKSIQRANNDTPAVRRCREAMAARGFTFGSDPQRVAASLPAMREPGADESEAA